MKRSFLTGLLISFFIMVEAQSWELKLNAGGNTTFVDNIQADLSYGRKTVTTGVPDLGAINNDFLGQIFGLHTDASNKLGFYVDGELIRHLDKNWSLSVSAGVNKINYTYDVKLPGTSDTLSMKSIDESFGDTKLLYISSRFLNVTKSFSNLSLTTGPVLNFLIHDNGSGDIYYRDNGNNTVDFIASPLHKPNKFIFGGNLALGYKLAKPLELKASAQYFFNSVYKSGKNRNSDENDVKANPFQVNLGLSFSLMRF